MSTPGFDIDLPLYGAEDVYRVTSAGEELRSHSDTGWAGRLLGYKPTTIDRGPGDDWREPTPWVRKVHVVEVQPGTLRYQQPGHSYGWRYTGYYLNPDLRFQPPEFPSIGTRAALSKALASLGENVGAAEDAITYRQTCDTVGNHARTIARDVERYKRRRPKVWRELKRKGSRFVKKIPDSWLELRFGWLPLINDVYKACELVQNSPPTRKRVEGRWETDFDDFYVVDLPNHFQKVIRRRGKHFARVVLYYELANPTILALSQAGFANPASLAWNLVPFSFVADWFVPVGGWLSSFSAGFGWSFKAGTQTTFTKGTSDLFWRPGLSIPDGQSTARARSRYALMDRGLYDHSPMSSFPPIDDDDGISLLHLSEGLSLLAGAFR